VILFLGHHLLTLPKDQPKIQETVDANGVRTIVEYTTNEKGKKIKVL